LKGEAVQEETDGTDRLSRNVSK